MFPLPYCSFIQLVPSPHGLCTKQHQHHHHHLHTDSLGYWLTSLAAPYTGENFAGTVRASRISFFNSMPMVMIAGGAKHERS